MSLRAIPAIGKLLHALGDTGLPRPVVVAVARREQAAWRAETEAPDFDAAVARLRDTLAKLRRSRLQPVLNGTGIVIHTNLGRSPLSPAVVAAVTGLAENYNNLEFDLETGERGGRGSFLEHLLALLCGAEAATVVNNGAAALVLILRRFTRGARREVVISRGELVQIGGGFRIPEILETSGACLREVGTTNKTTLEDYAGALGPDTALILKVHRSNFFMGGFVESPATEALATLAKSRRLPFAEDLGSGAVIATERLGLEHEPTPAEVLRRGVDLVCFSGDKLLGGPQAGIIAGRKKLVAACKKEPLSRALRCDKLILAALQAVVEASLAGDDAEPLPIHAMLSASVASLRARAEQLVAALADLPLRAAVGKGQGQVGGGTLPRVELPGITLDLAPQSISVADLAARLRHGEPPVIGYVSGGRFKLDLRTIFPRQDAELLRLIQTACPNH